MILPVVRKCLRCGKLLGTSMFFLCDYCIENEEREKKLREIKFSMKKHGKNIGQLYKNNVSKNNDTY